MEQLGDMIKGDDVRMPCNPKRLSEESICFENIKGAEGGPQKA